MEFNALLEIKNNQRRETFNQYVSFACTFGRCDLSEDYQAGRLLTTQHSPMSTMN